MNTNKPIKGPKLPRDLVDPNSSNQNTTNKMVMTLWPQQCNRRQTCSKKSRKSTPAPKIDELLTYLYTIFMKNSVLTYQWALLLCKAKFRSLENFLLQNDFLYGSTTFEKLFVPVILGSIVSSSCFYKLCLEP